MSILDHTRFEQLIHTYAAGTITRAMEYDTDVQSVMPPVLANLQGFARVVPTGLSHEAIALMYDAAIEQALQEIESDYSADLLDSETKEWVLSCLLNAE